MKFTIVVGIGAMGIVAAAPVWNSLEVRRQLQEPTVVHTDWTPPSTTIDPSYVSAAKALLGNGLADPRKGHFAHVRVEIGDAAWNPKRVMEADGWVQPDGKHAVLFDGVEYLILGQPTPADLNLLAHPSASGKGPARMFRSIDVGPAAIPCSALLLLVGRKDLAEKIFIPDQMRVAHGSTGDTRLFNFLANRYNMLTAQALKSHDDQSGLEWATHLFLVNKVRREQNVPEPDVNSYDKSGSLAFSRGLWADLLRRVNHPKPSKVDLDAIKRMGQRQRIETLVADLDEVSGQQWGQPGGVGFEQDPVYAALEVEGSSAVPALIDVLQNDKRYSRTVSFGRDFWPTRFIHSVKSVAWRLLLDIWPSARTFEADQVSIPEAAVLRTAWQKAGRLTEPERWVEVLKDDQAGEKNWLAAGLYLTKPADEIHHGDSYTISASPDGPMTGEALRRDRLELVSQLMAKRAVEMAKVHGVTTGDMFECNDALQLANAEAKWDPAHALQCLKDVCAASFATSDRLAHNVDPGVFAGSMAKVISQRVKANDRSAIKDYERLLDLASPAQTFVDYNLYRPLWECPKDSEIQTIGNKAMAKWLQLILSDPKGSGATQELTGTLPSTPILTVPSYRRLLAESIKSGVPAGTFEKKGKDVTYRLQGGGSGMWNVSPEAAGSVAADRSRTLSIGDYVAQSLLICGLKGLPPFHILGTESQRAQERQQLADWLADDHRDWVAVTKTSVFATMFQ